MDRKKLITIIGCLLAVLILFRASAFSDIVYTHSLTWPEKTPWIFNFPTGVAAGLDDFGYASIFVADRDNNRILKITDYGSDNLTITEWGYEGSAPGLVSLPAGVALGKNGDIFIADTANHRIQQWSNTAGYHMGSWGTEGTANGQFSYPSGVAVDAAGAVYVADAGNNRIQKFTSSGVFVAAWGTEGSAHGQFSNPSGLALDGSGNIYVADTWNNRIQKLNASGAFVASWGTEGNGNGQFQNPTGVTVDGSGAIYVSDFGNHRIQKLTSAGAFVGAWGSKGVDDGKFYYPSGIALSGSMVYIADSANNRIQKFTTAGVFSESLSNTGSAGGTFRRPEALAVAPGGDVYVADTFNCRIQRFNSSGTFISQWGTLGGENGETGKFIGPTGVAVDSTGSVYIADSVNNRIQKFTAAGQFSSLWGAPAYQFNFPTGVAIDGSGNVYVLDTGNNRVQKFSKTGAVVTAWGSAGELDGQFAHPLGIAVDKTGSVYVADTGNHRVQKFTGDGVLLAKWGQLGAQEGEFFSPSGIGVDITGNVYVVDTDNGRIQWFGPDGTFISFFGQQGSGGGSCYGFVTSCFDHPRGIAFAPSGQAMYVADTNNNRVQKFELGGIQITSPAGGEHWTRGAKRKITWTYLGNPTVLMITLVKGGDGVALITPNPQNPIPVTINSGNGSFDWTPPVSLAEGDDYQIAIQASTSVSLGGNFSIGATQVTHTVTPSATPAAGGTINPSTPKVVADGATTVFTLALKPGYRVGSVGGTCGGSLSGTKFTTNPVTADCTVAATFAYKPPTVSAVSPAAGTVGTVITVKGKYFGASPGTSTVTVGGVAVTSFTSWADTAIKLTVPEGVSVGAVPVVVTTAQGTSGAKTFTVNLPLLNTLTPISGTVGSVVTLKGKYFGGTKGSSTVTIGGVPVTTFVPPWTDTAIKATVPAGVAVGSASVVVTTPVGGSLPKTFTVNLPLITALAPTSGKVGSIVTIKGKYFGPAQGSSTVTIGGVPVTTFVPPWTDTAIKATVPAGVAVGSASVVVTTPVGGSLPKTFTVKP